MFVRKSTHETALDTIDFLYAELNTQNTLLTAALRENAKLRSSEKKSKTTVKTTTKAPAKKKAVKKI